MTQLEEILKAALAEVTNERDALRSELARLQRNEDCVQRLIVWAAENGWNGVDNSKILDSFIIGLFDQLRAELAAAQSLAAHDAAVKVAALREVAETCKFRLNGGEWRICPETLLAEADRIEKEDATATEVYDVWKEAANG